MQSEDGVREGGIIARGGQHACVSVAHDLGCPPDFRGHDRQARAHRLDDGQRNPLANAAQEKEIGRPKKLGHVLAQSEEQD